MIFHVRINFLLALLQTYIWYLTSNKFIYCRPILDVYDNLFTKNVNYSFDDDQVTKYGVGPCVVLKKGIKYFPRDNECDQPMQIVCKWNGKQVLLHTCKLFHFLL